MEIENRKLFRQAVKIVAKVTAVFMIIVAVIMVMQYIQLKKISPESSTLLPGLRTELSADRKNDVLRTQIRELDLLARRAWFTGQDQLRTGGLLLLGAGGVLLVAFILLGLTAKKRVDEKSSPGMTEPKRTGLLIALALTGGGLFIGALAVAFIYDIGNDDKKIAVPLPERKVSAEEFYANWPCFRGPDARGIAPGRKLFTDWDIPSGHNLIWKVKVPRHGYSSPVVWNDKLFVTGGDKKEREIYCYNANSGELLWRHSASGISGSPVKLPKVTDDTGFAASTPATDGQRIFAAFATGDLICVDFEGRRVWAKNLGVPENPYGYSSSLLTTPDKLIVQYDDERRQLLLAFDSATGRELWRKQRKAVISWSSPIKIEVTGRNQIVILTCESVEGFDLETGEQLWREDCMSGEVATSATFAGGRVLVANDNAVAAAIDPVKGEILWENDEIDLPDVSSPVALGDMMFIFTSGGIAECVNAETGELLWEHELEDGFYNSPLLVGDRIIVIDKKGIAFIIKPDAKKFMLERTCKVGEMVVATPVPGNNRLWIRGVQYLYCVGKKEQTP
jgi:outer membrane protein assembly factor BamB